MRFRHASGLLLLPIVLAFASGASAQPSPQPGKTALPDQASAESRLSEAARRNPDSVDAHYALASFYLQQGRIEAAIPHLERARAVDPAHYPSGYDLALAWLETGRADRARELISKMLGARETAELHNLLGDVEERAGNLVGAAEAYQRAAHMDASEEHLFDWGNNLLQLGAFEPAVEVFAAGTARHPASARLHVGLGIAQYSRRQYADAVASFCRAVDLSPSDPRPYQFLGEMYGLAPALGAEVTRRLAGFVEAQPDNATAHLYYALSLWKGQPAEAGPPDLRRVEALLRRAVALDPTLAKAFLQLGILLVDQDRYAEAIEPLRTAAKLEPGLAQAHYRLARAYQRTGQDGLAARELEIFEKLKDRDR